MLLPFRVKDHTKGRPVIIYGTSITAKFIYYSLKKLGIEPTCFADKNGGSTYMGYPVLSISQLFEKSRKENPIILLGVTRSLKEVILQLEQIGIKEYYDACELLERAKDIKEELKEERYPIEELYYAYLFYRNDVNNPNKLNLFSLDIVVSEKCSLRCKQCSNLMQYYKNPHNIDLERERWSLERFLEKVDCIGELRIIGGEPFMNPDFYKIIDWYAENPKIMRIGIYTNATIFPDITKLECLKKEHIVLHLSDYGNLSLKLQDWIVFCEENTITYYVNKMEKWHDCGKLQKRNYTYDQCKEIYHTCECNNLFTFLHGKLYHCPYAANAINLGALKIEEAEKDYLSFDKFGIEYTKEEIQQFLFCRETLSSCNYCSGRNYKNGSVPPYEQTKEPLAYEKVEAEKETI